MSWHLTVSETAFLVPAGVVLGAVVSYFAIRQAARDNLRAQEKLIDANAKQAQADREADLAREKRERRNTAYREIGGVLQEMWDRLNALTSSILLLSTLSEASWDSSDELVTWGSHYTSIANAHPRCRTESAVYGSAEVHKAVRFLGALLRSTEPPRKFSDAPGHYFHALTVEDGALSAKLLTVSETQRILDPMLGTMHLVCQLLDWTLGQIRYELVGEEAPEPLSFQIGVFRTSVAYKGDL